MQSATITMTMMQTGGASVSAAPYSNEAISSRTSPSIAPSTAVQPSRKQRYSSRSNSISGSSITTVQRAASRGSSQNGAQNTLYSVRSQSPGGSASSTTRQYSHSRRKSIAVDGTPERASATSMDSFNRWSQSTDSSAASKRHHRMSSGAMLASSLLHQLSPSKRQVRPIDLSPRSSLSKTAIPRPSSREGAVSPVDHMQRTRKPVYNRPASRGSHMSPLPALQTSPFVTGLETDTPSTASTTTPSAFTFSAPVLQASSLPDNHYSPINNVPSQGVFTQTQRPFAARTSTAPGMSLNYSRMPRAEDVKESAHIRRRSELLANASNLEPDTKSAAHPSEHADEALQKERAPKVKDRAEREKKIMLSKALEKANTAVVLDNKQNFLGALDAYSDACTLLQQVMDRSVNSADRRKLEAIKMTYSTRIEELRALEDLRSPSLREEKGLPERPTSDDSEISFGGIESRSRQQSTEILTSQQAHLGDAPRVSYHRKERDSFFSRTMADVERAAQVETPRMKQIEEQDLAGHQAGEDEDVLPSLPITPKTQAHIANQRVSKLPPPEETRYLPAPLATKKAPSPSTPNRTPEVSHRFEVAQAPATNAPAKIHAGVPTALQQAQNEGSANTWLDTIDESISSRSPSVHSISGLRGMHRKHIQPGNSDDSEALDAAFDAAVEAAYDEGLEPDLESKHLATLTSPGYLTSPSSTTSPLDAKEILSPTAETFGTKAAFPSLADDDEEERILDEFTQGYGHGFNFAFGTKSALPRQSDSSGYSRSTWQSSQTSDRNTAGTSLSTVAENDTGHRQSMLPKPPVPSHTQMSFVNLDSLPPSAPPPLTALPPTPPAPVPQHAASVRARRFSAAQANELKIETSMIDNQSRKRSVADQDERTSGGDNDTFKEVSIGAPLESTSSDVAHDRILKSPPSLDLLSNKNIRSMSESLHSDDTFRASLQRPTVVKKNQSSLSLRNDHTVLLPSPGYADRVEATPLSASFAVPKPKSHLDSLASQRAALPSYSSTALSGAGGSYLFDTAISPAPYAVSPPVSTGDVPNGLEPCPQSLLLRPFWLMRCLATTMTHPRGGYITTNLFVPREAWQTRGVKLKYVEDKISSCDLLTAALGRLAKVDTLDADLVMEELQQFEEVMEGVQNTLTKRLGSDVGLNGVNTLFKDAAQAFSATTGPGDTFAGGSVSDKASIKSHSSRGYLSSWRKLRSKSSGAPVGHAVSLYNTPSSKSSIAAEKEAVLMASVPMTSFVPVERRGQKKDVRNLNFDGPNREYMSSLARLFLGVQVLDQIARQVEDPGLKHSSQTHVGLELSIRHAAEFFSFYICRFVLADLGVLVDKFIKRGSEWVIT